MLVRGYVRTISDGNPVPNGTEVRIRLHIDNTLVATTTTTSGEYEHNFQGNPGPYYVEVEHAGEVHISSSKVIGMSGPTNIGGIPLLFRLWHDGYIPDLLDELEVTSTGVGMSVDVAGGAAICRGVLYDQSSPLTMSIESAEAQPRIDVIALQVVPAGADDNTEGRARIVVKKGVAASSPSPASLTQTSSLWEMPLAHVTVDIGASSIAVNKVADARPRSNVKIGNGYIETDMLADDAVTRAKIAADAIGQTELANDTVLTRHIVNDQVTTPKILNGAVTGAKIANGAVTNSKLGAGAVSGGNGGSIAYRTIDTYNLANEPIVNVTRLYDGAVTPAKLSQSYALASHSHSWSQITSKPSAFTPSSHNHSASNITSGTLSTARIPTISESMLATSVQNKINNTVGAMVTRGNANHAKTNYSSTGYIGVQHQRTLSAGTYEWWATGHLRCTGEASTTQVRGWLKIMENGTERAAIPFYTTADAYGIGVDVTGGGTFTLSGSGTRTFRLDWSRDTGTLTANTRTITVGIQKVS